MATSRIYVTTHTSGPLFDGEADAAVYEWLDDVKKEVAQIGRDWIRIDAEGFDRSGRGGTGRAADAVTIKTGSYNDQIIFGGMRKGEVWWPWLEGVSKRNETTRFKGYHTFRKVRLRLRKHVKELAQKRLEEFIGRMGGHVE